MMKRHMALGISVCCLLVVVGCNKKSRRPSHPSDSDGIPTIQEVLVIDVEEKIVPPPSEPGTIVNPAPAEPARKANPAPTPKPAARPAPKTEPKKVATAKPKKVNPLKAAFNKDDVLAVAEDTPRRPARKAKPAPKPVKKDKSPSVEEDKPAAAEPAGDPEVKAIQDTVIAFGQAIEKADAKAFKDNLAYSPADKEMLNSVWPIIKEMNGLESDMKKTYGQAGVDAIKKSQLAKMGMAPPTLDDIKNKMTVKVTGNKASLTIPGQSQPMTAVKVDGKWKVQLFKPGMMQGPQAKMMASIAKSVAGGIKNARKKIGKPGMNPKKIMQMVNASMMPGPGMIPANMKMPKRRR